MTNRFNSRFTAYGDPGFSRFLRQAFARHLGFDDDDLQRPIIGICDTESEVNRCHTHLGPIKAAIKRGVLLAGGIPMEFPTISLGEMSTTPTTMLYRNLAAMDTEEMIAAQPLDAVVLLGGCDKVTPAQLMGAASADVPALVVTGGPMANGHYEGRTLGACTDCRYYWQEFRAGKISPGELAAINQALAPTAGHCMVMGSASTMAVLAEALGMMLPGGAAIPATDNRRLRHAEESGKAAVALARAGLKPSQIMTEPAFHNAIRVLNAVGGSSNAVIHLVAIAGRLGIDLPLALFDKLGAETPWLANLRPAGRYQMEDFFYAGGVPVLLKELAPLLHLDCLTVTGRTLGENIAGAGRSAAYPDVIATLDSPLSPSGGIAVLTGSLAPRGAVIKPKATLDKRLLQHRGPVVVFRDIGDMEARIDDPNLPVTPDSVLVLQNAGPKGAPGMPEAGMLPIPRKLLDQGVRDMVRLSDARMSGTAFGTVVLHVAPEAAVGGPLALVQDGDLIELDVPGRRLELLVPAAELARRQAAWRPPAPACTRGYGWLFQEHVLQADEGCDFDFLRRRGR